MSKLAPRVSVLMSVYNSADYLQESVESILNQIFTNFEFIIIDDGSTDSTSEILTEYARRDQRVRLFKNEENIGLTKSLNKGLALSHGEYIARQDADDLSLPERLEKQVALLDEHLEVILVSCNLELINSEGQHIGKKQMTCDRDLVPWYLLFYNRLAGHSQVVFRRETVMSLGNYSDNRRYSQDYELWCRIAKAGKIAILPDALLKLRIHNKSISVEKRLEQKFYSLNQVRHNVKQLIGEEISIEEAEDLRGFWIAERGVHFPDSQKVGALHSRLKEISQTFLQQAIQQNSSPNMSQWLRILVGKRFICWIQALSIRNNLPAKIKISVYTFAWHPLGVTSCWSREIWKIWLRILHTLSQLYYKRDLQGKAANLPHQSS